MLSPSYLLIADIQQVRHRVDALSHRSEDIKSRFGPILKKLWNPERLLHSVSLEADFNSLSLRFPNFKDVIDYVESATIIQAKLNLHFEAAPILLVGDPGLGKTYFASEFAKFLGLAFYEISMATTTAVFALNGGDIQWAEGSPGFISKTLAESSMANPMIIIDELDKCSTDAKYNAMNVFYGLLETHTATRFRDEALAIELDASKIVWIATANELHRVPEPIQSRMKIFHIKQPDKSAMSMIVQGIYEQMLFRKGFRELLSTSLSDSVLEAVCSYSPRTAKLILEEAAFRAIRNGREVIGLSDLSISRSERNHVGFI